ncbi:CBS domain-containing protein [archaeon]|jgi:CBS domain-containing protein|nr:CBS domain-containing protein [archaeon]
MTNKNLRKELAEVLTNFTDEKGGVETMKIAKEAMVKPVYIYPDDGAAEIMKKLKREDTNVCVIINKDRKFLGEISVEDLIKFFLNQVEHESSAQILNIGYRREFLYKHAKDLINKHKVTAKVNDPINKIIKLIYKEGFNYIPLLDENKKVVGVVTPSSLINFLQNK